jgi:hypothetical protein
MSNQMAARLEEVFESAAKLMDAAEQSAFLDRACAGDAAMRAELIRLLSLREEAERFFAAVESQLGVEILSDSHDTKARATAPASED